VSNVRGTNWCTEPLRRKGSGSLRTTKSGSARTVNTGETDQESAPPSGPCSQRGTFQENRWPPERPRTNSGRARAGGVLFDRPAAIGGNGRTGQTYCARSTTVVPRKVQPSASTLTPGCGPCNPLRAGRPTPADAESPNGWLHPRKQARANLRVIRIPDRRQGD